MPLHWILTTYPTSLGLAAALLLSACAFTEPPKKEAAKPAEPVTGLHALYQMYTPARAWAQDLQILRYSSIDLSEVPRQAGKAPAWQVVFVSPSLAKARPWTFSVYEASVTLHQGIFPESPQDWSGGGKPFPIQAVRIDTDSAWETALKHAKDYASKNPNMPITYTLAIDEGTAPQWRVIWGRGVGESSFSVLIDATTGDFVRVLH
ncbi:MAG TPA: hypothetical protein VK789_31895 [Bryobacteraceae bacterium]|nr:hypothetical protein [Bryobacteraceae bacterium]